MSKDSFSRIDEKEEEIFEPLYKASDAGEKISPEEIFGSKVIPKILEEKPLSFIPYFHENDVTIPLNCLLFPKVLVDICPNCSCNLNPKLIRPYLEREMILPLLAAPLAKYRPELADLIVQYPYISSQAYNFLRVEQTYASDKGSEGLCPHCFEHMTKRILKKLSNMNLKRDELDYMKEVLKNTTFPVLEPTLSQETQMLEEIENVIDKGKIKLLPHLMDRIEIYDEFKVSRTFNAIPRVNEDDLSNIAKISGRIGLSLYTKIIEQTKEKELIARVLGIDYNPRMPINDYLDIILPRKKKINYLLDGLISGSRKDQDQRLSRINDELWKVNKEISASKTLESLTFLTDFVSNNAQIILSVMVGGLVGYSSASFTGCGLGSIGGFSGSALVKFLSRRTGLKVPKLPKTTIEWLKEKFESPEERLLSLILSKDIRVIQIWSLRKKLKRI